MGKRFGRSDGRALQSAFSAGRTCPGNGCFASIRLRMLRGMYNFASLIRVCRQPAGMRMTLLTATPPI